MGTQRATLVDHDELADLHDEPSVFGGPGNQDGQPPPVLQMRDIDVDTRERLASNDHPSAPQPRSNGATPSSATPTSDATPTSGASPVLFINDGQTRLNASNGSAGSPRVVVTQPSGDAGDHPTLVQPHAAQGDLHRALKAKDVLFIQVFAAVVCLCFPFTGVIAILHAHSTRRFFREGRMDMAIKYSQKAERFILCTIILGFMFLVLLIAIVEAAVNKRDFSDWSARASSVG